jgi:peroxiredoxin
MRSDLKVGARLPDLQLPDHDGRQTRLSDIAKAFPLIVTFYRGWW